MAYAGSDCWFLAASKRAFIVLVASMGLNACAFAPGMHAQTDVWHKYGPEVIPAFGIADSDIEGFIEVTPINDTVIDILEKAADIQDVNIPKALLTADTGQAYRIGINDVLSIVVWGQPELVASGGEGGLPLVARQVKGDGTIFFPYAGTIKVQGKTRQQIRKILTRKLNTYFQNPQIDVSVEQYNSQQVVLSGAFNEPSRISLQGTPLTLEQAIAIAKGVTEKADTKNLQMVRGGRLYHLNYHQLVVNGYLSRIVLMHGDAIYMPTNQAKAYIVGEVGKPQILPIQADGLTLTDALGSAGGLSPTSADGDQVYVVRGAADENVRPKVFRLSANSPAAFILAGRFNIRPQDVIFVGASGLTRWNRVISQLFPSSNLIRTTQGIAD